MRGDVPKQLGLAEATKMDEILETFFSQMNDTNSNIELQQDDFQTPDQSHIKLSSSTDCSNSRMNSRRRKEWSEEELKFRTDITSEPLELVRKKLLENVSFNPFQINLSKYE
jgi:hypothetical protein